MTAPQWARAPFNDATPLEILVTTIQKALEYGPCADCGLNCGYGQDHGLSQIWPGETCHIGFWLDWYNAGCPPINNPSPMVPRSVPRQAPND